MSYEPSVTKEVCRILRDGQTFVDVGANIGWYTLLGASIVGEKGKVLAIEPEPENFKLLASSICFNQFANVSAVEACVSDNSNMETLYLHAAVSHSTLSKSTRSIEVPASTLDELATEYALENIDLLKIDVEGAEAKVLNGALKLIEGRKIKQIICEWNHKVWQQNSHV